jgi:peptidoglycan/xylan/chitin deacetylase (PgdA/CDA1 family)
VAAITSSGVVTRGSIRAKAAENLHRLNILDRLLWLRARTGFSVLTVLTYHRIGDSSVVGELDPDVREVDGKGLSEQIAAAQSAGTIVSLQDVRSFFRGKRLPPNPVMLAFDDGYIECRKDILPMLEKLGVPATFFIPTAFPDSGRLFWWDRIHLFLQRCRAVEVSIRYPFPLNLDLRMGTDAARRFLLRLVKRTERLDLERFFDELARATNVSIAETEERTLAQNTIMSFRDVRALQDAGMAIASHSHAHRVLATLSPDEALFDLRKSRMILRDVLGTDVRTVGYPVGHRVSGPFRRAAALAGFDLGFTNATGLCWSGAVDALNVPRMAIGQDEPAEIYKWRMLVG